MAIATVNPTTNELLQSFEPIDQTLLDTKIDLAHQAFLTYRNTSFNVRSDWLLRVAQLLRERAQTYGALITLEMGKTLKSAIAEVEKCAMVCEFYAQQAEEFLKPVAIPTEALHSGVRYQPIGVVLAVMPWNFPFWQVFRFAAPALMAGNTALLKPASNVPQCGLAIEQVIQDAGFPPAVFQTLLIGGDRIADLMADPRIQAATLTGSEAAGASLAAAAGRNLKKVVLELGGSDPFIVLPSADLATAIEAGITSRLLNCGQTCISAKRFILHEAIADQFLTGMVDRFKQLKVGDPLDPQMDLGPLSTPAILKDLDRQVTACVAGGAKVLVGGHPIAGSGNFYAPTILSEIPQESPARQEEFFGPVALVFRVATLEEAIALANQTSFGLGASAWTRDASEREQLLEKLEAGCVFINDFVKSDPRLPFGGSKRSGWGRELGREGLVEFMNLKTVWVKD